MQARAGKTYWSPVHFRNETEPYVTLAVPVGKYAVEVTTAEVSLGAVLKMVSQIEGGPGGYAYVVDSSNRLVAHPDPRVLRSKQDLSTLAQVKSARADRSGPADDAQIAVVADGLAGGQVLAAHAPVGSLGWLVFVERPAADAYAPLRAPDRPERRHLRAGPPALDPGEPAPRAPDGRAHPGPPGRRGAHRRRGPRPSHRGPDRRRARGARRRVQPDDGATPGVVRQPGAEGRGADARARGGQPRPQRGARAADGNERGAQDHQPLGIRSPAGAGELVENAVRLCSADKGFIYRQDGALYRPAVSYGHSAGVARDRRTVSRSLRIEGRPPGEPLSTRRMVHIRGHPGGSRVRVGRRPAGSGGHAPGRSWPCRCSERTPFSV